MSIRSKPTRPVTASLLQAAPIPQTSPLSVAADRAGMDIAFPIAMTCIVLVAIDLRPGIVSTGPILPLIREEFGLSHTIASLLTAIPDLLMGALALPTPWLARRLGRDRVILGALALLFAATLGRAFAPSTAWLLLATAGVGAGIAVAGALIAGFIKASFPARAAFAMGIYATALSLGSTVSAAITGPIAATTGGWRVASGLWSVLGIVALSAWFFVARHDRPERLSRTSSKRFPLPVGNRTAWLVALFFACQNFLFYACITWLAPLFREDGFGATSSGLVLASFTVAFTLANPVFGALSRNEDRLLLALSGILAFAGFVLLAAAPTRFPFLAVPVLAIGLGGAFTLGMTLPLDNTHEPEEANAWNAFVLTIGYLIAASGPFSVGVLRDATGSFALPSACWPASPRSCWH
jgi:CP family cyanate transporter-like MFS transporter